MLLDVLSQLPELQVCVAYELDGRRTIDFPSHVDDLRRVVPVYETLPGWQQEITDVPRMEDLPANARSLATAEPVARASGGDCLGGAQPAADHLCAGGV